MDCIFCKITNGEIPATKVYETQSLLAFLDIAPQAPVHVVLIPKQHIESIAHINESNSDIMKEIGEAVPIIAKAQNLKDGFRVITNVGEHGAQSVKHLHFHIIGGQRLSEKIV